MRPIRNANRMSGNALVVLCLVSGAIAPAQVSDGDLRAQVTRQQAETDELRTALREQRQLLDKALAAWFDRRCFRSGFYPNSSASRCGKTAPAPSSGSLVTIHAGKLGCHKEIPEKSLKVSLNQHASAVARGPVTNQEHEGLLNKLMRGKAKK